MKKQIVLYPHDGIPLICKKEQTTSNNVDESQKTVLCERSQTREFILYDSIYIKFLKVEMDLGWLEADQQLPGDGAGGSKNTQGHEVDMVIILIVVVVS